MTAADSSAGATTFDPEFFGISPREAVAMDPQQRVVLRVSWRALENSGINPDDLAGHDVGCFVGASATGYGPQMANFSAHSGHLLAGTALSVISGRIAYTLGLAGPALTVDSSCASALAAFHVAVRSVQNGDCDLALAGGVNVLGSPGFFVEFSKQHALSDDGHCRPYSAQASGTVWAEGAAMFVLQRKSAALRAGRPDRGRGPRHRRQPGRPQRRAQRPQRRSAGPAVPACHHARPGSGPKKSGWSRGTAPVPGSATAPNCGRWRRPTATPNPAAVRCWVR